MTRTRAEAAYLRSATAFKNPTLDLLHGRFAPFVVAVLSVVFTPDRPVVAVADAHVEVAEAIEELRAAGIDSNDDRRIPAGASAAPPARCKFGPFEPIDHVRAAWALPLHQSAPWARRFL